MPAGVHNPAESQSLRRHLCFGGHSNPDPDSQVNTTTKLYPSPLSLFLLLRPSLTLFRNGLELTVLFGLA